MSEREASQTSEVTEDLWRSNHVIDLRSLL